MQSNRAAESPSGIRVRSVRRLQDCNHLTIATMSQLQPCHNYNHVTITTTSQVQPRHKCNHVTSLVVCHVFGSGGSGLYAEEEHVLEVGLETGISGHRQHIVAPHAQSRWRPTRRSCPASGAPCPDAPHLTSHSAHRPFLGQRQQRSRRAHPMPRLRPRARHTRQRRTIFNRHNKTFRRTPHAARPNHAQPGSISVEPRH